MAKQEVSQKVLDRILKLREDGKTIKEIMSITEQDYGTVWLHITDSELPAADRVSSKNQTAQKVKQLRDNRNCSWGLIRVMFGYHEYTEGRIRKLYEEASGLKSQGLRIGKGGRFYNKQPELYMDDRRAPGTEIASSASRADVRAMGEKILGGNGQRRVNSTVKKAAAKKQTPGKKAAAKKAAAKKTTKKVAKKATGIKATSDPFAE